MAKALIQSEISSLVLEAYRVRYPEWSDVKVTSIATALLGGNLVGVEATDEEDEEVEEVCYVDMDGAVSIFGTNAELLHFLGYKANRERRLMNPQNITALAFMICLMAVIVWDFLPSGSQVNEKAIALIGSVLTLAAGFFFGTQQVVRDR